MAKRIQRRRVKGWRMPEGAKYIGRPTKWGNPFEVAAMGREQAVDAYRTHLALMEEHEPNRYHELLAPLYGKDLACWCPLTDEQGNPVPCHADVLLELLAEQESSDELADQWPGNEYLEQLEGGVDILLPLYGPPTGQE